MVVAAALRRFIRFCSHVKERMAAFESHTGDDVQSPLLLVSCYLLKDDFQ